MKAFYAGLSVFAMLIVLSSVFTAPAIATPSPKLAMADQTYFIPLTQDLGPLMDLLD